MRKKKITIIIIVVTSVLALVYWHYHGKEKPIAPTVVVKKGTIIEQAEAIGYIKPQHFSVIKSQIDGTVEEIYHEEGDYVTKGEPLAKIKPAPTPEEYATIYQELVSAKAVEVASKHDLERYQKALALKLITKNYTDYIAAQKNYDTAKQNRILAAQKLALIDVGNTKVGGKSIANIVTSPADGFLINRIVDVGDAVLSLSSYQSSTALFTIANMHDLMFNGVVDEMDAAKIKTGMPAQVIIGSLPDVSISGILTKIALQSDKENSSQKEIAEYIDTSTAPFNVGFQVEITGLELPKEPVIRSGYSATAKIKIKAIQDILILPARVIQYKDDKPYVLLPPSQKNEKPPQKIIVTGASDGMDVEIKSGLKLGDKVLDKQEVLTNNNT